MSIIFTTKYTRFILLNETVYIHLEFQARGSPQIVVFKAPVYSPKNPPEDPLADAISQGPQGVNSGGLGNI
jgi:hypothetical protein